MIPFLWFISNNPEQNLKSLWEQKKKKIPMPARQNFQTSLLFALRHSQKSKTWEETIPDWNTHSTYTGSFKDFLGCNLSFVWLYSFIEMVMSNKKDSLLLPLSFLKLHVKPFSLMQLQRFSMSAAASCYTVSVCIACKRAGIYSIPPV